MEMLEYESFFCKEIVKQIAFFQFFPILILFINILGMI